MFKIQKAELKYIIHVWLLMQKLGDILSRQLQIQVRLSWSDVPLNKKYTFFPQSFS